MKQFEISKKIYTCYVSENSREHGHSSSPTLSYTITYITPAVYVIVSLVTVMHRNALLRLYIHDTKAPSTLNTQFNLNVETQILLQLIDTETTLISL